MKRMHVHVGVDDLAQSTRFYTALFDAPPTVTRPDYAKWMLDDPRLNFAISAGHAARGIEHLGIEVEDNAELAEVYRRLQVADRPVLDEGATTCCYARSTKSWIADPQGVVWETFLTAGAATTYGGGPALAALGGGKVLAALGDGTALAALGDEPTLTALAAADGACCVPVTV